MTFTATTATAPAEQAPTRPRSSRALAVRRGFLVAAPLLAGAFAIVGAYADPASGISGSEMNRLYAENPGPLQFKSLGYHWSYAFWIGTALLVAPYVRAKGAWLANIGAFLGFVGMTTLPGLLAVDWYDSAVGQLYGPEATTRLHDHMDATMWGLPVFFLPGIIGLMLALPVAMAGMARAGLVRWFIPVAALLPGICLMALGATVVGNTIAAAFLAVVAWALARATR